MKISDLSDAELYQALAENHEAIAATRKYQSALALPKALPIDDSAKSKLMLSNNEHVKEIESQNREVQEELDRRAKLIN